MPTAPMPGFDPSVPMQEPVNPNISQGNQSLQSSIGKSVTAAQTGYAAGRQSAGAYNPGLETSFAEKGIRMGKKVVAQNEFNMVMENQKKAIQDYAKAAGFTDDISSNIAQTQLNDRLNKIRIEMIKRGLEFDKRLAQYNASEEERRKGAAMWGQLAGTVAGGVIGAYAGGPMGAVAGAGVGGQLGGTVATNVSNQGE